MILQIYPTGRVIHSEDFEGNNFLITKFLQGSGTAQLLTTDGFQGNQCGQMTTTGQPNDSSEFYKWLGHPLTGRIGFEFAFKLGRFPNTLPTKRFQFGLERIGNIDRSASFDYRDSTLDGTPTFRYAGTTGTPDTTLLKLLPGKDLRVTQTDFAWYTIKMVVDFSTLQYVAFIFGSTIIDMSGTNIGSFASNEFYMIEPYVWAKNKLDASALDIRTDNWIITDKEPDALGLSSQLGLALNAIGTQL